jgi:hypothetical protein
MTSWDSIRYKVAVNLVRLEAMWFLVKNKRYRNHVKNVRQRIPCNSCKWFISRQFIWRKIEIRRMSKMRRS